jgi:hypothetical protein
MSNLQSNSVGRLARKSREVQTRPLVRISREARLAKTANNGATRRAGNPAWRRGVSGNPLGVSSDIAKAVRVCKEMAANHSVEAINKLVDLMRNAANETIQYAAAIALLDRGIGKPKVRQQIEVRKAPQITILDMSPITQKADER